MQTKKYTKYEFTGKTIGVKGRKLNQIKAICDFGTVKAGEIGGWIENESNLSHEGHAWVKDNAKVYGEARVQDDAVISGNAEVYEKASVSGEAKVFGYACIRGEAKIQDKASVRGYSLVYDQAVVRDQANLERNAEIDKKIIIEGSSYITGKPLGSTGTKPVSKKNNASSDKEKETTKNNQSLKSKEPPLTEDEKKLNKIKAGFQLYIKDGTDKKLSDFLSKEDITWLMDKAAKLKKENQSLKEASPAVTNQIIVNQQGQEQQQANLNNDQEKRFKQVEASVQTYFQDETKEPSKKDIAWLIDRVEEGIKSQKQERASTRKKQKEIEYER